MFRCSHGTATARLSHPAACDEPDDHSSSATVHWALLKVHTGHAGFCSCLLSWGWVCHASHSAKCSQNLSSVHKHGADTRNHGNLGIVRYLPSYIRADKMSGRSSTHQRCTGWIRDRGEAFCLHGVWGDKANNQSTSKRHTRPIDSILGCGRAHLAWISL